MTQTRDGLTEQEIEVVSSLALAWVKHVTLGMQDPSELKEFADGVDMYQKNLAMRALRRECPDTYPIVSKGGRQDEG